ncbi:MAG: NADH-quinone oxidoreductase subunit NuoK [Limisphaerales bacterium]|jgi:NADH:ubiquinone oxidoreductase subunit K
MEPLHQQPTVYLAVAAFLFATGVFGLLRRKTLVGMLIAGELIFAAAALNFMALNRFMAPDRTIGQIAVLFILGLTAAEVCIALSIVIAVYRNYRSISTKSLSDLNG